jgi:hypothetical protein
MWKIAVGFVVFAALAMFVIFKGGNSIDMSGEKHGADAVHAPEPAKAAASVPVPAAAMPQASVPAASAAMPAASVPAPATAK